MSDLTGKVAIVTGGAQGVGGGISRKMALAGAKVLVADIDLKTANKTVDGILDIGGMASAIKTDVNSYEDLKLMVNDCLLYTSPSPRDRSLSRMPSSA